MTEKNNKLLVIIPDRLSDLIHKGEITERYYNPGNLFDEVHILMTNDDHPDPVAVQKTVGDARLLLHNLSAPLFRETLGWQPKLMKKWTQAGINLAKDIQPVLMRTHGNLHNGYLAAQIKKTLGIPMVVSLHTHPDLDMRRAVPWWRARVRLKLEAYRHLERETLTSADRVIIVYEPQREYALRNGARDVRLIYNVVNPDHLKEKEDYQLHQPARIISVGRLIKEKNPENLIRALKGLEASLTIVGDGDYRAYLVGLVNALGLQDRVEFIPGLPNDKLAESLADYDIFATHCDYVGIPKAVIEPLLVGLPVVINHNSIAPVPELEGDWVFSVENSAAGYQNALKKMIADQSLREALGKRARLYARESFLPSLNEAKVVSLYQELLHTS
jgi:glycosyltransferase involved in cell wall biosynthesis